MEFLKHCINDFDTINPRELHGKEFYMYLSIDKYLNYTIPKKEGKIEYNKDYYKEYCNLFRDGIKNGIILPDMKIMEIYDKIPYDNLDKWSKISIIKKLKNKEQEPIPKSQVITKFDKEYIDDIISCSHSIMSKISQLSSLIETMKQYNLTQEDVIKLIIDHESLKK